MITMVNSTNSNGSDIIQSVDVDQQRDQESSKVKHLFTTEIFERDELWNDFNIVQQVDVHNSSKTSSGVWKYFGKLHYDNQIVDEGYFYCISCYANRVTKKYQTNTSTGNLIKHMIRAHDILLEHPIYRINRQSDSYTVVKEEFKGDLLSYPSNGNDEDVVYDINEILIAEVHKRPQLYNPILCRKNKHQIRQDLWFQVYETLNHLIPLERLPKIWKNIRDRYQKVRRSCEKDENKVPKYRYYEKLRFLDSIIDSSMNRTSQSILIKMNEDEIKEKLYYMEHKSQDELFEVLELDVDDMENVEVSNENDDTCDEEMVCGNAAVKSETMTRRRSSSEIIDSNNDENDDLSNYEFQDNSEIEIEDSELFSMENRTSIQPPSPKRVKTDITLNTNPEISKSDVTEKSSTLCEFEIFGNYVAAVMKNMRKNDARQLQMKIVQLINSYDEDESV